MKRSLYSFSLYDNSSFLEMERWEILEIMNIWKCSIFRAALLEIEGRYDLSYAVEWLICLSCSLSGKFFLTKYFTLAFNVGQKYEQFTILRFFEKYVIFKTTCLKIEQGTLIIHITVKQNTSYSFKNVLICFWNWHLGSCQFGAEIWENL